MSTRGSANDRAMYKLLPPSGNTPSHHIVHTHLRVLLTDYTPERLEFGEGLRVGATRAAPLRRDAGWQTR